ncbi:hypothetical protein CDAR_519801 [Caerostris darwini]|uniref:Recombination activating protein 1 n=1 Tax=Caerostris darwini TaxID=1538125 RepID=A0AAV4TI00_9ARAC|nr:hypothetical protein CDAR_519801 [Caerostris darwini]
MTRRYRWREECKKLTCGICPLRQDPHERLQEHDHCQPDHHHLILPVIVAGSPDHLLLLLSAGMQMNPSSVAASPRCLHAVSKVTDSLSMRHLNPQPLATKCPPFF